MKLSNLKVDFKNFFGLDFVNENILKKDLNNYVSDYLNTFISKNQGKILIFEVLDFIKNNFVFNSKNELTEIKDSFLNFHKKELLIYFSKSNLISNSYGDKEFYFINFNIFSLFYYLYKHALNKNIVGLNYCFYNFNINKKHLNKEIFFKDFENLHNILSSKDFNLGKFKYLDELTSCNFSSYDNSYYIDLRNTKTISQLKKRRKIY